MDILRRLLSLMLVVSASTACVTVNVHVGDKTQPIAGDIPVEIGDDGVAGDDGAGTDKAGDVESPAEDTTPPADETPTGDGGGEVIVLGGGGWSTHSLPDSAAGDGPVIVVLPDEPTGAGLPDADGDEAAETPGDEDNPTTGTIGDGGGGWVTGTAGGLGGVLSGTGTIGDLSTATRAGGGYGGGDDVSTTGGTTTADVAPTEPREDLRPVSPPPSEGEIVTAGVSRTDVPPSPVPAEPDRLALTPPDVPVAGEGAPSEPEPGEVVQPRRTGDERGRSLGETIDAYLADLQKAAYAFNPPSPIKVDQPRTIHLWLDPQSTPPALSMALSAAVPEDAARVEAGESEWSPIMEATLTGSAFAIKPVTPARQSISARRRTEWTWEITATRVGKALPLYLTLNVVLPEELGPPSTVATLDAQIDVEVTVWWAFDHYFERYWSWLLGGLGTAFTGVVAWWWKRRSTAASEANG